MLKKLYLHHFRNLSQVEITFSPGVNWITGKNAQGKTNLIEALYLLSSGRSFRTPHLSQLIQKGAGYFYLEAEIEKAGVVQTLKISFDGENKKVQYNASQYSHFTPLIGLVPHVLYAPEDIALITGAPCFRRKFINLHLAQYDPLYLHHLARYHKAMRQRNELLRKKTEETIEPWEISMAHSAQYLMEKRQLFIQQLRAPLQNYMNALSSETDHLEIQYQSSLPLSDQETLLKQWQKNRSKELYIGSTLYGPHRDDLYFAIGDFSAKSFASEGQKHSIIASVRLAQIEHLQKYSDSAPLFSVDDFGAHLDQTRQENFQRKLSELGQIFLTSPEATAQIFPEKQVLKITSGEIYKCLK